MIPGQNSCHRGTGYMALSVFLSLHSFFCVNHENRNLPERRSCPDRKQITRNCPMQDSHGKTKDNQGFRSPMQKHSPAIGKVSGTGSSVWSGYFLLEVIINNYNYLCHNKWFIFIANWFYHSFYSLSNSTSREHIGFLWTIFNSQFVEKNQILWAFYSFIFNIEYKISCFHGLPDAIFYDISLFFPFPSGFDIKIFYWY